MALWNSTGKMSRPKMTIILAVANVIYFFYLVLCGAIGSSSGMVDQGAIVILNGSYTGGVFPIIASMFIHFDIYHLGSNLLIMMILGEGLEERLGGIRMAIAYFASGIIGNVATIFLYGILGKTVVTAGASGAVFGLVGMLCVLLLRNRGTVSGFGRNRMILMVFFLFYNGIRNAEVNNIAHAAGFITGILFGFLFHSAWKAGENGGEDGAFSRF